MLQRPKEAILQKGGLTLMATYNGEVAGTVALNGEVYKDTKMAVDHSFRRKGIAEAVSRATFDKAK